MLAEELVRELPKGLLKWYEFHKGSKALFVAGGMENSDVLAEALVEIGLKVDCLSLDEMESGIQQKADLTYEYVVLAGILERSEKPEAVLQSVRSMLQENGRLLLYTDNRLGLRYFCGDRDLFTGRNFDSIENYSKFTEENRKKIGGHAYAKAEIAQMLDATGFQYRKFYTVLPGIDRPQMFFAEDYLPEEELEVRITPQYNFPDTVFLEEEKLYTTLIQNGMFHAMANGYFIECPLDGGFVNAKQITVSMDRGYKDALATIICQDNKVIKKALYEEGKGKLVQLLENNLDLQAHGLSVIDAEIIEDSYVMPYVCGETAINYFRRIFVDKPEFFLEELDRFRELINSSSEHVSYECIDWEHFVPDWKKRKTDDPEKDKWRKIAFGSEEERENLGFILKRGYIDLVPLNCFYIEGNFVFYDQEFYMEHLPANAVMIRAIDLIYRDNRMMEKMLPKEKLLERYHLDTYQELWHQFGNYFLTQLRNERELSSYHQMHRRDQGTVNTNRQRINYPVDEYERLFRDIFRGTEGKQIYLFGSGIFTKKFLAQFGTDYEITGILDNNPGKWNTVLEGVHIDSPDSLRNLPPESYKVIICVKDYLPIVKQLIEMGVQNYSIYDRYLEYPRKVPIIADSQPDEKIVKKKYHIGYVAGVFDLFHIGHLNMFRRAKEQCDYLITGVVSDAGVVKWKKTAPYIPFEERIELVRACKYVDEAVEIPVDYSSTEEAYYKYRFDVQFSGSDYEKDPVWMAKKAFLQKHGSDLVFFPYTQSTSSTRIKELIERKLI